MKNIKFRVLNDDDISIMKNWLSKEYILKWYKDPDEWIRELNNRFTEFKFVKHFIVTSEDKPIGFCQYYACSDAGEDWYGDTELEGTYSIDYLIGEEQYLGKGYGKAIISHLVETIFSLKEAKRIIVKPEEDNLPSVNALLANGFVFDKRNKFFIKTKE